jgi:Uma2 family endonuclease
MTAEEANARGPYNVDEFHALLPLLEPGHRYELLDGVIRIKPPLSPEGEAVLRRLDALFRAHAVEEGYEVQTSLPPLNARKAPPSE